MSVHDAFKQRGGDERRVAAQPHRGRRGTQDRSTHPTVSPATAPWDHPSKSDGHNRGMPRYGPGHRHAQARSTYGWLHTCAMGWHGHGPGRSTMQGISRYQVRVIRVATCGAGRAARAGPVAQRTVVAEGERNPTPHSWSPREGPANPLGSRQQERLSQHVKARSGRACYSVQTRSTARASRVWCSRSSTPLSLSSGQGEALWTGHRRSPTTM